MQCENCRVSLLNIYKAFKIMAKTIDARNETRAYNFVFAKIKESIRDVSK